MLHLVGGACVWVVAVFSGRRLAVRSVLSAEGSRLVVFSALLLGIPLHTGVPAPPWPKGFDGEPEDALLLHASLHSHFPHSHLGPLTFPVICQHRHLPTPLFWSFRCDN